jgi:hypothetical protein
MTDLGANSGSREPSPASGLGPSGFDPGREAVLVSLIYDDGEHEPHEVCQEAICLTPEDAHAFMAERFPEARRVGGDELAAYNIIVNGMELDMTAVLWRVPLWPGAGRKASPKHSPANTKGRA